MVANAPADLLQDYLHAWLFFDQAQEPVGNGAVLAKRDLLNRQPDVGRRMHCDRRAAFFTSHDDPAYAVDLTLGGVMKLNGWQRLWVFLSIPFVLIGLGLVIGGFFSTDGLVFMFWTGVWLAIGWPLTMYACGWGIAWVRRGFGW